MAGPPRRDAGSTLERAPKMSKDNLAIVNLSGRGDKDVQTVANIVKL